MSISQWSLGFDHRSYENKWEEVVGIVFGDLRLSDVCQHFETFWKCVG